MLNVTSVLTVLQTDADLTQFVSADNIYGYKIPDEFKEITPLILVTDIRSSFTSFGSNHANGRYRTVQIQAWFDPSDSNIEQVELLINSIMESNKWYCSFDSGIDIDPDSSELFFTMQFSKNDKLN